jgi:hypothetical protein
MIATARSPEGQFNLFLAAADDKQLLSPLEVELTEIGTEFAGRIAAIEALEKHTLSSVSALVAGGHFSEYKITGAFDEIKGTLIELGLARAVLALREGHAIALTTTFIYDVLGVSKEPDIFGSWDARKLVAARTKRFGNLSVAAWREACLAVRKMTSRSWGKGCFDEAKRTVTVSGWLFEKIDFGRDVGRIRLRYDAKFDPFKVFLQIVMSLHTDTPFADCKAANMPEEITGVQGAESRAVFKWHASASPGISRIRPFAGNDLAFEFATTETYTKFVAEMEALPNSD